MSFANTFNFFIPLIIFTITFFFLLNKNPLLWRHYTCFWSHTWWLQEKVILFYKSFIFFLPMMVSIAILEQSFLRYSKNFFYKTYKQKFSWKFDRNSVDAFWNDQKSIIGDTIIFHFISLLENVLNIRYLLNEIVQQYQYLKHRLSSILPFIVYSFAQIDSTLSLHWYHMPIYIYVRQGHYYLFKINQNNLCTYAKRN